MLRSLTLALAFLLAGFSGFAGAQDVPKWKLNKDRMIPHDLGVFGDSDTYFVPKVVLHVMAEHRKSQDSGGGNAYAIGAAQVEGLDKAMLQGLAAKVQEDLVAKIRGAGYKVVTWDDLKDDPALAGLPRGESETRFGLPLVPCHRTTGLKFLAVTPTDETATLWMNPKSDAVKALAREKNFVIVSPDIRFTAPQITGKGGRGSRADSASLEFTPEMKMYDTFVNAVTPKGKHGYIQVQEHTKVLAADVAGELRKTEEERDNGIAVGDFVLTANPAAYTSGLLRVGYAVNDLIVETIDDEH